MMQKYFLPFLGSPLPVLTAGATHKCAAQKFPFNAVEFLQFLFDLCVLVSFLSNWP